MTDFYNHLPNRNRPSRRDLKPIVSYLMSKKDNFYLQYLDRARYRHEVVEADEDDKRLYLRGMKYLLRLELQDIQEIEDDLMERCSRFEPSNGFSCLGDMEDLVLFMTVARARPGVNFFIATDMAAGTTLRGLRLAFAYYFRGELPDELIEFPTNRMFVLRGGEAGDVTVTVATPAQIQAAEFNRGGIPGGGAQNAAQNAIQN